MLKCQVTVGIVISIEITRDSNNKTYINDIEFIKDKDNILIALSTTININLFNITIDNKRIILVLKSEYFNNNILSLNRLFVRHKLFKFNSRIDKNIIKNTSIIGLFDNLYKVNTNQLVSDSIAPESFEVIDKDDGSNYYPIKLETKAIELWQIDSTQVINNYSNILKLLETYGNEFMFTNPLSSLLVYGINK